MNVVRFPQLAHWGAFTALVEDNRVIGCEPFARDPAPSDMLEAIPAMVHSPLRIARPAIREGWREGKERTGHDRFREVSWGEALDAVAGELARVRSEEHTSELQSHSDLVCRLLLEKKKKTKKQRKTARYEPQTINTTNHTPSQLHDHRARL